MGDPEAYESVIAAYLRDCERRGLRPATVRYYAMALREIGAAAGRSRGGQAFSSRGWAGRSPRTRFATRSPTPGHGQGSRSRSARTSCATGMRGYDQGTVAWL